jgi:benzil reductase ((S)-benzoin forming)
MKKTIIITGASSGIGKSLAEYLASLQHHVIAVGRNQIALEELKQLYPENIKIVVADINNKDDQLKIKEALDLKETGIFLVHSAGIATPRLLSEITEEEWDQHYLTNVRSPLFLTKLLLPYLKNGGRVLNVSTGLAHTPLTAMSAYGVSKSALFMLKEYFNVELKNSIAFASAMPGVVDTPIQMNLRSCDSGDFPAVELFKGFYSRGELLHPRTAAKFLSWLLLDVESEKFIKGDWDIYDKSHHAGWAKPGEVIPRQTINKSPEKDWCSLFSSIAKSKKTHITAGAIAAAGIVATILMKR